METNGLESSPWPEEGRRAKNTGKYSADGWESNPLSPNIELATFKMSGTVSINTVRSMNDSPLLPVEPKRLRASPPDLPKLIGAIRARTPARILVGRAGPAYRTATQLELRQDHAAALDAVHAELDLQRDFGRDFADRWKLFEVRSQAAGKTEYLMRPDLGRHLDETGRKQVIRCCPPKTLLQVVIGDGLSAAAVAAQVPRLLPLLEVEVKSLRW